MTEQKNKIKSTAAAPDWDFIRSLFRLNPDYLHLGASQFIASHPRPVRQAIARYRRQLDQHPVGFTQENEDKYMQAAREAAARYFGVDEPDNIAMTDSTTMGLGTIYSGLNLQPDQEILTTNHDHYSQQESIRQASCRSGAQVRSIDLYRDLRHVSQQEMVDAVARAVGPSTRLVGLTWVHSSTGLKVPVPQIARALADINRQRDEADRVLLLVDGVHGFGIELESFAELGCDFFISGCHKWLYGPRGTGLVAATTQAWQAVSPIIPSFTEVMDAATEGGKRPECMNGRQMTPGGFHSLEHRWALREAFEFIMSIGKRNICERVHELNRQCKAGLAAMPHVTLHTPQDDALSAGIISFEVAGYSTGEVVEKLKEKQIIATKAPYQVSYARLTPGIINTPEEVNQALAAIHALRH